MWQYNVHGLHIICVSRTAHKLRFSTAAHLHPVFCAVLDHQLLQLQVMNQTKCSLLLLLISLVVCICCCDPRLQVKQARRPAGVGAGVIVLRVPAAMVTHKAAKPSTRYQGGDCWC